MIVVSLITAFVCILPALRAATTVLHEIMSRQVATLVTLVVFGILLLAILGISITVLIFLVEEAEHSHGPPHHPGEGHPSQNQTTCPDTVPFNKKYTPEMNRFTADLYSRINFSVDPCDDFYEYACDLWTYSNPVPSYMSSWTEYTKVSMAVSREVKEAIENADLETSSEGVRKAKNFYDKCMDTVASEKVKGMELGALLHTGKPEDPSLPGFDQGSGKWPIIDKSYEKTIKWEAKIGQLKKSFGIDTFVLSYALQYDLQSNKTVLWLTGQMLPLGLGLFQFDYYLNPKMNYVMDAYQEMQKEVATLLARDSGFGNVNITDEDLQGMLEVEKQLANITMMSLNEGDYSVWTMNDLKNLSSTFDWDLFFKNLVSDDVYSRIKADGDPIVQLNTPNFFLNVINLLQTSKDRDLQNYAIWRLVKYSLPYLSSEYTAALDKFNNVFLGPRSKETPRSDVCLTYIKGNFEMPNLGFATAEAYGKKYFGAEKRKAARDLVVNVKNGLETIIKTADWMDEKTRQNALDKAVKMDMMIAYPDWTMNTTAQDEYYQKLEIPSNVSFISLNLMLRSWAVLKNFDDVLFPVDRRDFVGSPVRTDAWYTATRNAFTMPVGELQYPFYGYNYPTAMNYGAVGAVAGHEMSHGFDVQGSQYDANGNLNNWWSPESKKQFQNRTNCLINQFNKYCYEGIGCVNGTTTVAENAADLAGLKAAYQAYQALPDRTSAENLLFTDDQLFFLSFSSFYCGSDSVAQTKNQLVSNTHSPGKFRVIGTLRNIPEFAKAFQCKPDSYMNPSQKCSIW